MGIPALKAHRQAAGISQSEIAREFGVATRTVQRWEGAGDEDTTPDLGVLLLLKEKYRCKTIVELLSPPAPRQRRRSRDGGAKAA
mgnify:FL=1